jgi:succinate-acetate transporter protein
MTVVLSVSSTTVRSSAIYCAFPIFFPGNANLLIGVLNWSSEEPSWGAAFPGTLTVYSTFYTVLCGKASAKIILAIDSNNSHPVEVDSKCIFPDSSHFSELYIILKDIVD